MDPIFPETIETKIMVEKNIIGGEPSDNLDENQKQNQHDKLANEENINEIKENDSSQDSDEDNVKNPLCLLSQQIKEKKEIKNVLEIIKDNMAQSCPYISSDNDINKNPLFINSYISRNNIQDNINILNNINIEKLKIEKEKEKKIIKTCLKNYGETYYLNSILQNLSNIEYLKNYFLKDNIIKNIEKNGKQNPLSYVLQRIVHHFYNIRDEKYSIKPFLKVLASINLVYASKKSRNVQECFTFILNTLHNELNRIKNPPEKNNYNKFDRNDVITYGIINLKNTDDSIISDIFNWSKIAELHCTQCGKNIYNFNSYNIFQLNLLEFKKVMDRNNFTIYDIINYELTKKEELNCENCRNQINVNKLSFIYSSPKIFVFFLEKGDFSEELLEIKFILEEKINLNKFIENKNSPIKYELIGIISINKKDKKYHSFCKSFEDQQWYHFNDETVMQKNDKQVLFNNNGGEFIPNILFYKSID